MSARTIRDLTDAELRGKRVLVRVDFNVPMDAQGAVTDDTRIRAALPTLDALLSRGARVLVLLSHLGRPKGKPDPAFSLAPVARHLRAMARLGDLYVNDAFGSAHRAHASTEGVARHLHPAVAGLLMERELCFLGEALTNPARPFAAVLGGAKISGKIDVIEALLPKVDRLLVGGAMACTFFRAMGLETGGSLVEPDRVAMASELLARAGDRLVLPEDAVVAPALDRAGAAHVVPRDAIPAGEAMFDIGPRSASRFAREIAAARTIVWNGPMGVFETPPFDAATHAVAEAMARATEAGATTIVGGGDSAAAVEEMHLAARMTHVSTGGGASLEFLEGKALPGVAALDARST
jgi:phosphoglycerate kinase